MKIEKKLVKTGTILHIASKKSDSKKCAFKGAKKIESIKIKEPKPTKKSLKKNPENILGTAKIANELTIFQDDSPTPDKFAV